MTPHHPTYPRTQFRVPESGPDFSELDLSDLPPEVAEKTKQFAEQAYVNNIASHSGRDPASDQLATPPTGSFQHELLELNAWVNWLRHEYGLPAQIVPPMWHRHPEMLWELSALRQHWLFCFDAQAEGNQALAWHHDFAQARERLRDWVTTQRHAPRPRPPHTRDRLAWRRSRGLGRARNRRTSSHRTHGGLPAVHGRTGCSTTYGARRIHSRDHQHRLERPAMTEKVEGALVSPLNTAARSRPI